MTPVLHRSAAALATVLLPTMASAQWLDYFQVEGSANNASLVLVKALRDGQLTEVPALISATAARWEDGQTVAIGLTPRWSLVGGEHQWLVGVGVGANKRATTLALSIRAAPDPQTSPSAASHRSLCVDSVRPLYSLDSLTPYTLRLAPVPTVARLEST